MKTLICWFGLALLVLLSGLATGCSTTGAESDNVSDRPWATPRGYDSGLPGMDNYRR